MNKSTSKEIATNIIVVTTGFVIAGAGAFLIDMGLRVAAKGVVKIMKERGKK